MKMLLFLPIFSLSLFLPLPFENATSTRDLDTLLQDYAFKALSSPKTGLPYDAKLPNNLTGIKVSAMRLKSGSLRTRGFQNYKEFHIPIGVIEKPYVKRLVLVYQNLGNFSEKFYPLPNGFSYLTPVLGLLPYSGVNQVHFDIVFNGNVCKTVKQGHFSIVVESNNASSSPIPVVHDGTKKTKEKKKNYLNARTIVALCLVGGCLLLLMLVMLLVVRVLRRMKLKEMELESENNEALQIKHYAGTKLPVAGAIRNLPTIDYLDF
ncbi:hypothetical protein P8452_74856 [Trifolium repens]|nr:hypothetical protein P8452_74856 [Trifolium repens]